MGPAGGRSTGRPSPPPTPGRHLSPDRKRAPEGSAPATRRGPGRSTTGRRLEREQGGRGATPPPPRPPTGPPAAGAPAPTPRGRRGGPPRPRGEPECDPPPRPSRRLQWGPRRASGPTPAHRDAAQIVPREAGWARTGMVWVATPPMDSTTPRDARFVANPGKAAPQPANH